jgi:hypothetical protein
MDKSTTMIPSFKLRRQFILTKYLTRCGPQRSAGMALQRTALLTNFVHVPFYGPSGLETSRWQFNIQQAWAILSTCCRSRNDRASSVLKFSVDFLANSTACDDWLQSCLIKTATFACHIYVISPFQGGRDAGKGEEQQVPPLTLADGRLGDCAGT